MPSTTMYGPDKWGPISIPLGPQILGQPAGDPALFYIADFLKAFLSTDANVTQQWTVSGVAPTYPPVAHYEVGVTPTDKSYSLDTKQLPALFVYRNGGKSDWWGDDWAVSIDELKILWVMPLGNGSGSSAIRSRLPFYNAMYKGVFDGIEVGRSPSWVQPNETEKEALGGTLWQATTAYALDAIVVPTPYVVGTNAFACTVAGTSGSTQPTWPGSVGGTVVDDGVTWQNIGPAQAQGSLMYSYAGFVSLNMKSWKPAITRVISVDGKQSLGDFPTLEMSLELIENLEFGTTNRVIPNSPNTTLSLTNESGAQIVAAIVSGQALPAPTLTSLSVSSGTVAGGTAVTLTGTGFVAGAKVNFGTGPTSLATSVVVSSATTITCNTPASTAAYAAAGPVRVVVTNNDGQSTTAKVVFTYTAP